MMQLYCSRYLNKAYPFYWRLMGLCYANPPFSQLSKVLTTIALREARVVPPMNLQGSCRPNPAPDLNGPANAQAPAYDTIVAPIQP